MTGWATTCPEKEKGYTLWRLLALHMPRLWRLEACSMSRRELKQAGVTDDVLALHSIIIPSAFALALLFPIVLWWRALAR